MNDAHHFMSIAARLAIRGHGGSEPNPLVGCVIVSKGGEIVGWGYHRQCGGAHAEVHALRRAAGRAAGATVYCTLEPCNHTGRTGPCTEALLAARVGRVVIARRDPHGIAAGGVERLRAGGVPVEVLPNCEQAMSVSDPFARTIRSGLPWVIAKWAQSVDGRIATAIGESRWISGERSRRLVHRERGRVDAILTGIGTVLKDDPQLTARGVRQRRTAKRIVIDPRLAIPENAKLVRTAGDVKTIVVCDEVSASEQAEKAARFREAGVEIVCVACEGGELPLTGILRRLAAEFDISTVLVEAGAGLMGRLFRQRLVNEALVFIAPLVIGDERAVPAIRGSSVAHLTDGVAMRLVGVYRRGEDVMVRYRVPERT